MYRAVLKSLKTGLKGIFRTRCLSPLPALLLAASAALVHAQPQVLEKELWPAALDDQVLLKGSEYVDLEIAVVVFESGLVDADERDARYKVREVESRLAASRLRDVMTASGRFGAVRVLPRVSAFAAVTVSGKIVHSDGRDFVLEVQVVDAEGRVWLQQTYRAAATLDDYLNTEKEPFDSMFIAITNAIWSEASLLTSEQVTRLNAVAQLRYAQGLVPEWFNDYLVEREGRRFLQRLPAVGDPMIERIKRVRNQEALFIDTVDEQYVTLRDRLGPTYRLWRRSSLEQALYLESYQQRASERTIAADRGSFAAMQQIYSTYRSVRIQEQDLFELATGFDNETAPTVMASGETLVRLEGTLEQQYTQWRDLLARIIRLERDVK